MSGEVTWVIGTLAGGQGGTVNLTVEVKMTTPPGAEIINLASITSDETGPTPTEATETTRVAGGAVSVYVDIKPGTCPNAVNLASQGVLPVAILGTEDFDVGTIDPSMIRLTRDGMAAEVAPIRWAYKDVATPFIGEVCDCHELGPDGFVDLTLKFETQEVVSMLDLLGAHGQTIPLMITGNLRPEYDGLPIIGEDCVWVKGPLNVLGFDSGGPIDGLKGLQLGLDFHTTDRDHVVLEIYDVHGRKVRTLIDHQLEAGSHSAVWDWNDEAGRRVPVGVYFARLRNSTHSVTTKLLLVE
jgi:hypothetical protein